MKEIKREKMGKANSDRKLLNRGKHLKDTDETALYKKGRTRKRRQRMRRKR